MAFVPIANACSVELRLSWSGQRCELTFGFSRLAPFDATTLQAIADKVASWWAGALRANIGSQISLTETYARALDSETAPSYTSLVSAGTTGSLPSSTVPQNLAFCVSFRTAQRGRANRGRNYVPVSTTSHFGAAGYVSSAYRNVVLAHYQKLLPGGTYDPTPARWCVLSRQLDGVVMGRAVPIIAVVATNDAIDSMRRRLPGRGL
jgi:hypothetical protein